MIIYDVAILESNQNIRLSLEIIRYLSYNYYHLKGFPYRECN